jgi:RNA polymerase sigma factor (sigma-70 family)
MRTGQMPRFLDHLRRAALLHDGGGLTDGQLLARFVRQRDGDAFAALVRRHGSMVLGVCRRILLHRQDAEDAFQATFFVFARKAASVVQQEAVGGWLYRVAYRTALEARAKNARRQAIEQQVKDMPHPQAGPEESGRELLPLLDRELDRLPDRYRVPVVLCELEGRSRKEVACQLRIPEGTLSSRLAYAKKLLAKRLARYGAGALVAVLSGKLASASVPSGLLKATTSAALHVVARRTLPAGVVSAQVVTLTEGVLKIMFLSKLKVFGAVLLAVCVSAAVGLGYRAVAAEPRQAGPTQPAARATADELEELRLEVAALRKGLEATRQRVKTLESEVQILKASHAAASIERQELESRKSAAFADYLRRDQFLRTMKQVETRDSQLLELLSVARLAEKPYDPYAEAEAALKKLRANAQDKQAVAALEQALQRFKSRQQKQPDPPKVTGAPANPAKP